MSIAELSVIEQFVKRAVCPEDVFGAFKGAKAEQRRLLKIEFHKLAKAVHPDLHASDKASGLMAEGLFKTMHEFHEEAQKRIENGTYGHRVPMPGREPIVIKSKYVVNSVFAAGDIADLHSATLESGSRKPYLLKIARNPADNDLLRNEKAVLDKLREELPAVTWRKAVPHIVEDFLLDQGGGDRRRVNVMLEEVGFLPASEIRRRIPRGLNGRTIGWMWKRLLVLIEWTTKKGYIHGAILPCHVAFYPDNATDGMDERKHSIRLFDWCYAVEYKNRTRLSAWVPAWKALYAPEIIDKAPLSPQTDLYMGAMTMLYLAGAKIDEKGAVLANPEIPASIGAALMRCIVLDPKDRPKNIGKYFEEFRKVLEMEYGRPRWQDFDVPAA